MYLHSLLPSPLPLPPLTEEQLVLKGGHGVAEQRREAGADVLDVEVEADGNAGEGRDLLLPLHVGVDGGHTAALHVHSLDVVSPAAALPW